MLKHFFTVVAILQLISFSVDASPVRKTANLTQEKTKQPAMKTTTEKSGWSQRSNEEIDQKKIYRAIAQIAERYGTRNSAYPRLVFELLQDIGTPTSFKILKERVERGQIPEGWLTRA